MDKKKILSERLKYWRKKRHLTQEELAARAETTQKSISSYETARIFISYENARNIAKALDISPLYLLCETNNPDKIPDNPLPPNVEPIDRENARKIPLYTAAGAGGGKVAEADILEMIDSDIGDFGVKIRGDSMSPVVENGEIVIIEKVYSVEDLDRGQMVIVRVNGDEAVLKYLTVDEETGHVVLRSENFDYPPKFLPLHRFKGGDCEVIGKVVEIRSRKIPRG